MEKILTQFSENTSLIERDGRLYVKKRISADDVILFQKLIRINDPCLAKVFEICFDEEYLYALIEYIPGKTLSEVFEDGGIKELKSIILVALNICEGLGTLHKNGIIHRDINPNNIVIRPNGQAVIIDYGISRTEKENKQADTTILGTAGYAAPEQFGFRQTSAQSDIYSVGVLLNYLQNGKMPNEEIPDNDLALIIKRCTRIKPDERFKSTYELAYALTLVFNKLFPKEKIAVPTPHLKRTLLGIYFFIASVFFFVFVFLTEAASFGERISMFFLSLFTLFVPQFFINFFNSRQRLFYYSNTRTVRIVLTLSTVFVCLLLAFIIIFYDSQKWAGS